jgi:hypothetical protein
MMMDNIQSIVRPLENYGICYFPMWYQQTYFNTLICENQLQQ